MRHRKSYMEMNQIYSWTARINQGQWLLKPRRFKEIIIDSLSFLSRKQKIDVFGFTIMPNHMHAIWRMKEMNGKEAPWVSLLKFTGHEFRKRLFNKNPRALEPYRVQAANKIHEFWNGDVEANLLATPEIAFEELNKMHHNPLATHWNLASRPGEYKYSSASFYESGKLLYPFLKNLYHAFYPV